MLTFEVPLVRVRMGKQVGFTESRPQAFSGRVPPMARCLALGHRIVQAVESGEVPGYGEVAQRMGVSQPRVSMLAALTFLSPRIQEVILAGGDDMGFHALLRLARVESWLEQEAIARTGDSGESDWGKNSPMVNPTPEF